MPTKWSDGLVPERLREAVALAYHQGAIAPTVVAKGKGLIAEEILARAKENGIHVHESPALLSLLMQVDLDEHIPETLYRAVAELLIWVYRLEQSTETMPLDAIETISEEREPT